MLQASEKKSLQSRVDKHLVACAAAAAGAAVVGTFAERADAVIHYSGPLNFHVNPNTQNGIYINVQTFGIATTAAADPGWNLNPFNIVYNGGYTGVNLYPHSATTDRVVGTANGLVSKLAANTTIGPASTLMTLNTNGIGAFVVFYPGGAEIPGMPWHADGSTGFMGFKVNVGGQPKFGWARIQIDPWNPAIGPIPTGGTTPAGAAPITLIDMAWEDQTNTAIQAGAGVPEPTTAAALGLLALGAAGIRPRRKA